MTPKKPQHLQFPATSDPKLPKKHLETTRNKRLLVGFGMALSVSGFILQGAYHLLKKDGDTAILGLNRSQWNLFHVAVSLLFVGFALHHLLAHKNWYHHAWKEKRNSKHRPVLTLSAVFLIASLLGLSSWLLSFIDGAASGRTVLLELHDKIALLFFILLLLHVWKRRRGLKIRAFFGKMS